jgi:multiple sugar transport system permease protein
MSDKARTQRNNFFIDVTLFLICFLLLLPLILLISNAFKTPAEILSWPPSIFPKDPTLENFRKVFTETPLLRWIFNSLAFAVLSTIAIVATSALAGYVVAKFPFRSINIIFVLFLATAIIPFEYI